MDVLLIVFFFGCLSFSFFVSMFAWDFGGLWFDGTKHRI